MSDASEHDPKRWFGPDKEGDEQSDFAIANTLDGDDDLTRLFIAHARRWAKELDAARAELNTPHTANFLEAVRIEAACQRERWNSSQYTVKEPEKPEDWFWLLGGLGGKALQAAACRDREKALHHTISSAAVLLNWHAHITKEEL